MDLAVRDSQNERDQSSRNCLERMNCLEQREHTRYGVRAHVDFEWMEEGVLQRDEASRATSAQRMFIYSDSRPPTKADLQVKVSFGSFAPSLTKVK